MSSNEEIKSIIEDCLHLANEVLEEHFGSIEDIREVHEDREEVNYRIDLKTKSHEIILKKLLELKMEEIKA
ncbi:hypothetical protein GF319_15120 [Candidatus Bathyarchaeota archaeon]|nr:hypothetical protein [Candidatus Bathyarchaeota archaeon]